MSFKKRFPTIFQQEIETTNGAPLRTALPTGVRPLSYGRLSISTGTRSLDVLLAEHGGIALGTSLLLEESGTTDFGGVLLRFFAAEGLVHGHQVHVLGFPESWARELPGIAESGLTQLEKKVVSVNKMKIAWRYEKPIDLDSSGGDSQGHDRNLEVVSSSASLFCHDFDLTKRLTLPANSNLHFVQAKSQPDPNPNRRQIPVPSPFDPFLNHLERQLLAKPISEIHRVIVPTLLSPAVYPSNATDPGNLLQFLHALRGLLRRYPRQLSVVITVPLALYPRSAGLTRWVEILSDGVLELSPFPRSLVATNLLSKEPDGPEGRPQGLLKIHRLPVFGENGGGSEAINHGADMVFNLSRRRGLMIHPFSIPPSAFSAIAEEVPGTAEKTDFEF